MRKILCSLVVVGSLFVVPIAGHAFALAQDEAAEAPMLNADTKDVGSVDGIMAAIYDVISGAVGEVRDWDRMRSLFIEGGRLIPNTPRGPLLYGVEEYIARVDKAFTDNGFFEVELSRKSERYGNIVHVFSTYAARRTPDGEIFARGINSFQLVYKDERWWIVNIFWQGETPDTPIPDEYLK
ncbi:MAG: hypothetical protein COB37_05510 [Kordiimonadales bacterium]|nr:MAG: hypothetical protein COB37_05510 [Kordiimonadales bacterium]